MTRNVSALFFIILLGAVTLVFSCRGGESSGDGDGDTDIDGDADTDLTEDADDDSGEVRDSDAVEDTFEDADGFEDASEDSDVISDGDSTEEEIYSTLVVTCDAELATPARAVVNWNTNLGISFTESDLPYSFIGSISFEFPSGFTGSIDNPENYEPGDPRHTVAVVDRSYTTYGNHCWEYGTPAREGSGYIENWEPGEGIVRATFTNFPLQECISRSGTCTISGTIETTGEGVFE